MTITSTTKLSSGAEERQAFKERLLSSLSNAGIKHSAAVLTREHNLRSPDLAVSVHAARRWILGETIPEQKRLHILAEILGVGSEWLRYGDAERQPRSKAAARLIPHDVQLIFKDAQLLDGPSRELFENLVKKMLQQQAT